ncbi:MAG: hemolysin family protein, partial [Acidobacteria bacterium]|nr:hemolysin family protein [Acidobacteriota bacterium]
MEHVGARLVLIAVIIAFNGFFAAAEVALVSVRVSRLRQMAEEGESGAQAALNLLANPERLLSVTQVGVTLASLGLGWAGEETVYQLLLAAFHPAITPATAQALHALSFALAFLIISYLHIVLGEVLPKNIAFDKADRLAVVVAPALVIFYRITMLFVLVIEKSSSVLSRALGVRGETRGGGHSAEEIKLIIRASRGMGFLPPMQEDMLRRILELGDIMVREIMVPRNDVVSVPVEATLEQVLYTVMEYAHSRLPVYEGRPEQIVGVLYSKDLLALWEERRAAIREGKLPRPFSVRRLMRKYLVVPETKPLTQMLEE